MLCLPIWLLLTLSQIEEHVVNCMSFQVHFDWHFVCYYAQTTAADLLRSVTKFLAPCAFCLCIPTRAAVTWCLDTWAAVRWPSLMRQLHNVLVDCAIIVTFLVMCGAVHDAPVNERALAFDTCKP